MIAHPQLTLDLFGRLTILHNGQPVEVKSHKAEALLVYLALQRRPQGRDGLATLLWPEASQARARANLRRALWTLNQTPLASWVDGTTDFVALRTDDLTIDAVSFEELLAQHPQNLPALERAALLYGGDLLTDFSLADCADLELWLTGQRESYRRLALRTLHALAEHHLKLEDYSAARHLARRQIAMDNLYEPAYRQLFSALAAAGQRTTALNEYAALRGLLRAELDAEPSQQTTVLIERIRSDRFAATVEPSATTAARTLLLPGPERQPERSFAPSRPLASPYRGLLPFREEDAAIFFGREELVSQLLMAVQQRPFTALIGPSGAGKTSAIHAGLIPALRRRGDWMVVFTRPGSRPFHALAASLLPCLAPDLGNIEQLVETRRLADALHSGQISLLDVLERITHRQQAGKPWRLLLVVDHFADTFSLAVDSITRQRFIDALLGLEASQPNAPSPQFVVIVALRADFLGQALAYRPLTNALHGASIMLGPMTRAELTRAVVNPAHLQQVEFEPGLAERILRDVGVESGNLPLLEFALTALWERQESGRLTHAAYEAIGGVDTALTQHAEAVIAALTPEDRATARRVFMQLVRPGDGTGDTSRTATAGELGAKAWRLATGLADSRLLVAGRDSAGQATVEIIHVALIHHWGRLQGWIEEDRAFRLWQERLRTAMSHWESQHRDEDALLRGAPLATAQAWLIERPEEIGPVEAGYVAASVAFRMRGSAESALPQPTSRQTRPGLAASQPRSWRARSLAMILAIALLALLGALIVSYPR
jgi:DNA-binding SARP family transcriptional activator